MESRIIKLKKPFEFEGEKYEEINLDGLEELTAADLIKVQKEYKAAEGTVAVPETEYGYLLRLAALVAQLPLELFLELPAADGFAVKIAVSTFLTGTD